MAQATGTTLPGMSSSETDVQPLLPLGGRASGDADQAEIRQRTFFRKFISARMYGFMKLTCKGAQCGSSRQPNEPVAQLATEPHQCIETQH